jgi:hypothetical protein
LKTKPGLFFLLAKLGKDTRASGPRLLARLIRDEKGSYLLYMTFIMPVLIGVGGLAGEASLLLYNHRTLQSAADAAAYSAAIAKSNGLTLTGAQLRPEAQAIVASYGFTLGTGVNQANVARPTIIGPPYGGSNHFTAIQVSISRPQSAIFSSEWFPTVPNNVSAIAVIWDGSGPTYGGGNCVLALGNTATGNNAPNAIQIQGGGNAININAPDCGIFSDSTASNSVAFGGNAKITAGSLGSAGSVSTTGNPTITLPPGATYTQNDGTVSDPYAGVSAPTTSSSGSCTTTTTTTTTAVDSSGRVQVCTLSSGQCGTSGGTLGPGFGTTGIGQLCPGVYPNGLNFTGTGNNGTGVGLTITLQSGIYILDCGASCPTSQGTSSMLIVKDANVTDGTTSSTAGSASTGGVTLAFECSSCTSASQWPSNGLLIGSNGNITLSAPASGSTAGYVMMGGSGMPLSTVFDTHSDPNAILVGTVFMPNGAFLWGGNPVTSGGSSCLEMVVNTMQLYGDSGFGGSGCTLSASGGSGGAGKAIGPRVTLVD